MPTHICLRRLATGVTAFAVAALTLCGPADASSPYAKDARKLVRHGCIDWRRGQDVAAYQQLPYEKRAVRDTRSAAELVTHWGHLYNEFHYLAGLPETGNSAAVRKKARRAEAHAERYCFSVGKPFLN